MINDVGTIEVQSVQSGSDISVCAKAPGSKETVLTVEVREETGEERVNDGRDSGASAWKVLAAAVIVDGFLVGFPLTFGIFQQYYQRHNGFEGSIIGVLSVGVPWLGAPLMTFICHKNYIPKRHYVFMGSFLCITSLVAAAFCNSLWSLALTQGLCYGLGIFISEIPLLLILNTWFSRHRGLAYGILFASTDLLGFTQTFLANTLLSKYGPRVTFLAFAALLFTTSITAIFFLAENPLRISRPTSQEPQSEIDSSERAAPYYQRPIFYILNFSNLLQATAFYLPFIYLPSYTSLLTTSTTLPPLILALGNLSQIFGEVLFGRLSDILHLHGPASAVIISSLGASLSAFLLWGLAGSYLPLIFFALLYGGFGSGFLSLWARMGTFFGEDERVRAHVYSWLSVGRGLGSVVSGPASLMLLRGVDAGKGIYGLGKYVGVVGFVGGCMGGSALLGVVGMLEVWREKRRSQKDASRPVIR